jgi:hypothetical protein
VTQGDKTLPLASEAQGLPGPLVSRSSQTPSPLRKPPEGAPGGGQSKPTRPDGQSVRAEEPNDVLGFSDSTTTPRSIHAAAAPS